ncbi:MAG: hypothetical protein EOM58_06245 [Clostridia bacterium]|nr:hypothetical protein [Clostridia bacterium]
MAYHDPIPCPVCGEEIVEAYDICETCGWQNDLLQFHHPDMSGGANPISLNEARENYAITGRAKPTP